MAPPELEQKMEYMMGQIMAGMQVLQNRLINLEATQQPPKNTEENPSQETTPSQDSFKLIYSTQGALGRCRTRSRDRSSAGTTPERPEATGKARDCLPGGAVSVHRNTRNRSPAGRRADTID